MRRRFMALATCVIMSGGLAAVSGVAGASAQAGAAASGTQAPETITVDGSGAGQVFDGVGGVSAGASSRLLYDYPPAQRSQILDYLFKPDYGASLQILKVEIGGGSDSTAGAEPSIESTQGVVDCNVGYEWWLMEQAQARNPNIVFYGLEWAAPGWFQPDPGNPDTAYYRFWSQDNIDYIVSWLGCARQHGLHVSYVGGWNEDGYDAAWYEALHATFVADDIDTKIVASDGNWDAATAMSSDPAFAAAVDVVGVHDPCGGTPTDSSCPDTAAAQSLGKPVWDTETSSLTHDTGAPAIARSLNRDYIDGRMTAHIYWSLVSSWYADGPIADTGLMLAETPWSGYYDVGNTIWTIAQTTQFAQPGWRYLDDSSGYLSGGGSYVSLRSPSTGDYSTIVETTTATAPQTVQFSVTGGLSAGTVHEWSTDLSTPDSSAAFIHDADLSPSGGTFTATLLPDHVYTFSTTTGQHKGSAAPSASAGAQLAMPYHDNFNEYPAGSLARYFSDVSGSFATAPCAGGRTGMCYQQMVPQPPIPWFAGVVSPTEASLTPALPTTLAGDPRWWGNYQVSVDADLASAPWVELLGRVDSWTSTVSGYHLRLAANGAFTLYTADPTTGTSVTLASGTAALAPGAWHNLTLAMTGNDIKAIIDGVVVADVQDQSHTTGQVGLEVGGWSPAQFDNLSVTPDGPSPHLLSDAGMTATATSVQPSDGRYDYLASNAIDDRPETLWLAASGGTQSITVDLGSVRRVAAMTYQPRLDGSTAGMITNYTISTSLDGNTFTTAAQGTWPLTTATKVAPFDQAVNARYVRLTGGTDAVSGCPGSAGAGELGFSSTPITDMRTVGAPSPPPPPFEQFVPQSQMTATATSEYSAAYGPSMAIDGNCATSWQSAPAATDPLPAAITLNLGGQYDTTGLTVVPRVGLSNGWIQNYVIYVSTDGSTFTQVAQGTWPTTDGTTKYATWPSTPARYVRLQALSGLAGVAGAAEINVAYDS